MSDGYLVSLLMSAGIYVGFGLHALTLAWQARQRAYLYLLLLALLESGYCLVAAGYFREVRPEAALPWARAICVFTPFITYVFGLLVMDLTRRTRQWPAWFRVYQTINLALTIAFSAQVVVDALRGTSLVLSGVVLTDIASKHRHRLSFAPLGEAWLLWVSASFVLFACILFRACRTRRQLVPMAAGCAAYFVATISDFGILSNLYDAYFVQHLGFFALVFGCWWALASRYELSLIDLRRAIERLEEQRRKLLVSAPLVHRHKLDGIGALAAGVAHEIYSPVQGIMNYATLLAKQAAEPASREFAGEILDECAHVTSMLKALLSFARADEGQIGGVSVRATVEDVARLLRSSFAADDIHLELELDEDLPELHDGAQRLKQVVINLLTNARDALAARDPTRKEPKTVRVVARARPSEGRTWLVVDVIDNADGIEDGLLDRIFDPFFTTKPPGRGTGLGLSISQEIVAAQGGHLTCRSARGKGSCFRLELPIGEVTRRGASSEPQPRAASPRRESLSSD